MVLAETPRALVLAFVTGVGAPAAPDGAATPNASALPITAMAPLTFSTVRLAPEFLQRRIATPGWAGLIGRPGQGYRRRSDVDINPSCDVSVYTSFLRVKMNCSMPGRTSGD